jgi:rare lipoprotein A
MNIVSRSNYKTVATLAVALAAGTAAGVYSADLPAATIAEQGANQSAMPQEPSGVPGSKVHLDRSGRRQVGKASFYADRYAGRTMADGTPMNLYSNNAASLTLPLGTIAKVTSLDTGRSAIVTIRDRGPYVKGRIVDLSPATAKLIGMSKKQGLAQVAVVPIAMPDPRRPATLAALRNR